MHFLQRLGTATRVERDEFLLQVSSSKKVLHLGCVDSGMLDDRLSAGNLLHSRLDVVSKELWGLDVDAQGVRRLQSEGFGHVYAGSVENPPLEIPRCYFDVIIAGEIIEHVRNAGSLLDSVAQLIAPDGVVVITTPNALRFYNPLPAVFGLELTHPDHLSWYSPHTLRRTVELSTLRVESLYVYCQTPQAKCNGRMGRLQSSARHLANFAAPAVHGVLVRLFPYLSDGLVLVARPSATPSEDDGKS